MPPTIELTDFRAGDDLTAFRAAAAYLKTHPGTTLHVPPGVYRLCDPEAAALQEAVMRGELGSQPQEQLFNPWRKYVVGVDLSGCRGVTVDAAGATLLWAGFLEPFRLEETECVMLKGFTLDYLRRPYSKGIIESASDSEMVVDFGAETLIHEKMPLLRAVAMEPDGRWRCAATGLPPGVTLEALGGSRWRLRNFGWRESAGALFAVTHSYHFRPAIHLFKAVQTRLEGITIHSHHGMGVVAFQSRDVELTNCVISPAPGEPLSTNTDATHFASCRGRVVISGCRFDHQGDDAANVHNYYHTITGAAGRHCTLELKAPTGTHTQERDLFAPGDRLELTDPADLAVLGDYVVKCHTSTGPYTSDLEVDRPLPVDAAGKLLCDVDLLPEFDFVNNRISDHFARGVLVKSRRVRIRNNDFRRCCGTAIHVAAEAQWAEGAGSADVTIIGNRISHCGRTAPFLYGLQQETGGIVVNAAAADPRAMIHRGIVIAHNEIDCPETEHAVYLGNARGILWGHNTLTSAGETLRIVNCEEISVPELEADGL